MEKLLHRVKHEPDDGQPDFIFWCPGCGCAHGVWTTSPNGPTGAKWSFNGDESKPTFHPSLRIRMAEDKICHVVVNNGTLNYCSDCTHSLANKSIPMQGF